MSRKILFGRMDNGEEVFLCRLSNRSGSLQAEIITLGATIKSLWAEGRNGETADVVLGQDTLEDYEKNPSCSGACMGRVANRIGHARFEYGKNIYCLQANDRGNCLHSGSGNYAYRNFNVEAQEENRVKLSLTDRGEGGFPGRVNVTVEYRITEENALEIHYTALPTEDTPISLTNHVFFNLGGHGSGVPSEHKIEICADFFTDTDENCLPTGEILRTEKTPLDFREPVRLGKRLGELKDSLYWQGGFDHNYVLRGRGYRQVAAVWDETSGRKMEVYTDQPGLQFFTGNHLEGKKSCKDGIAYKKHSAYCFETQNFPDAVNLSHFPNPIVHAGTVWRSRTTYQFSII